MGASSAYAAHQWRAAPDGSRTITLSAVAGSSHMGIASETVQVLWLNRFSATELLALFRRGGNVRPWRNRKMRLVAQLPRAILTAADLQTIALVCQKRSP